MAGLMAGASALLLLPACAALPGPATANGPVTATTPALSDNANRAGIPAPEDALAASDLAPDPDIRYGRLPNGMFYAIRANGTPEGTAEVRFALDAGSLDESADQRGFAHYVEHMAFNGSTRVPEGEMVPLLEREGLAFGADTNASTGFDRTIYQLRLPRTDAGLVDTALMLMREVASELQFDPDAVDRERGVLQAERRDRDTYQLEDALDRYGFETPDALYVDRWAGGTEQTLTAADAASLKAFWQGLYRPDHAALVVVGDIDPDAVEAAIRARFGDWAAEGEPAGPREYGSIDFARADDADIHLHPALSERTTVFALAPALTDPDDSAARRDIVLRQIGYDALNRRLKSRAREAGAPFRSAGFGTGEVFRMARVTRLIVDSTDGTWERGLKAAASEYRRVMERGFTQAEIDEQVADLDRRYQDAANGEETRSNGFLVDRIMRWIGEGRVPTTGPDAAARYEEMRDAITPDAVLAAMKQEVVTLGPDALIRFRGKTAPDGGTATLRTAWEAALDAPLPADVVAEAVPFAYTDFGPTGEVVADARDPEFGIRTVRFANNVRLNLKHTDLARDQVLIRLTLPGGDLLISKDDPLAVELVSRIPAGGLGAHDADAIETLTAGRRVSFNLGKASDAFVSSAVTRPEDLELQLQLMTALLTDPGWREEPVMRFRGALPDFFARLTATPGGALTAGRGAVISDGDPRFSQQDIAAYRALDFAQLRQTMAEVLTGGPIEIAIVGDIDEDRAIALVAETLGTLPKRAADYAPPPAALDRAFTDRRGTVILRHDGEANQALIERIWPTTDDADPVQEMRMELLERVTRIALTEALRERLGEAYSPAASSSMSSTWPGWGTFLVRAQVDVARLAEARKALDETLAELRDAPIGDDLLNRARAPMVAAYDNMLKSNSGWLALADRAQTEPDRLKRVAAAKERALAVTADELQAEARRWLADGGDVEFIILPRDAPSPVSPDPALAPTRTSP